MYPYSIPLLNSSIQHPLCIPFMNSHTELISCVYFLDTCYVNKINFSYHYKPIVTAQFPRPLRHHFYTHLLLITSVDDNILCIPQKVLKLPLYGQFNGFRRIYSLPYHKQPSSRDLIDPTKRRKYVLFNCNLQQILTLWYLLDEKMLRKTGFLTTTIFKYDLISKN